MALKGFPQKPDNFAYWIITAMVTSVIGAYVFQYLKDADPITPGK